MSLELEAARQKMNDQLINWESEFRKVLGVGIAVEIDPLGLPHDPAKLGHFAEAALSTLRNALNDAAQEPKFVEHFRSRVSKILLRNDDAAPTSRFDYDVSRRLLVIITTSELRAWVDFLALLEFLKTEL